MVKSLLAVALAVASIARADYVTVTATGSHTLEAPAAQPRELVPFDFSGLLDIPQFNPALGDLNGIRYDFILTYSTHWNIGPLPPEVRSSYTDLMFYGALDVLDTHENFITMSLGFGGCWAELYAEFPSICGEYSTYTTRVYRGESSNLSPFIGDGFNSVPVANPTRIASWGPGAASVPTGEQQAKWTAEVKYNYTPTTATPEPRHAALLLAGLLAIGVIVRQYQLAHRTVSGSPLCPPAPASSLHRS